MRSLASSSPRVVILTAMLKKSMPEPRPSIIRCTRITNLKLISPRVMHICTIWRIWRRKKAPWRQWLRWSKSSRIVTILTRCSLGTLAMCMMRLSCPSTLTVFASWWQASKSTVELGHHTQCVTFASWWMRVTRKALKNSHRFTARLEIIAPLSDFRD